MRLIDADELIVQFRRAIETFLPNDPRRHMNLGDSLKCHGWEQGLMVIQEAPTIQPSPHWIPCSAELPKTNDPVNVTYVNHNPGNYYAEVKDKPYTATAHFHKGQWYWYSCTTQDLLDEYGTWIPDLIDKDVEILAWMPLPEPYKGVTE